MVKCNKEMFKNVNRKVLYSPDNQQDIVFMLKNLFFIPH